VGYILRTGIKAKYGGLHASSSARSSARRPGTAVGVAVQSTTMAGPPSTHRDRMTKSSGNGTFEYCTVLPQ
jgi:hypothetical protein